MVGVQAPGSIKGQYTSYLFRRICGCYRFLVTQAPVCVSLGGCHRGSCSVAGVCWRTKQRMFISLTSTRKPDIPPRPRRSTCQYSSSSSPHGMLMTVSETWCGDRTGGRIYRLGGASSSVSMSRCESLQSSRVSCASSPSLKPQ